jgi:hypothetical protein
MAIHLTFRGLPRRIPLQQPKSVPQGIDTGDPNRFAKADRGAQVARPEHFQALARQLTSSASPEFPGGLKGLPFLARVSAPRFHERLSSFSVCFVALMVCARGRSTARADAKRGGGECVMNIAFRVCLFLVIAVVGFIGWQWTTAPDDVTQLAVQQFQDDGSVSAKLQDAAAMQNWWPLVWPVLLVAIGVVMFWDDAERLWKHESV